LGFISLRLLLSSEKFNTHLPQGRRILSALCGVIFSLFSVIFVIVFPSFSYKNGSISSVLLFVRSVSFKSSYRSTPLSIPPGHLRKVDLGFSNLDLVPLSTALPHAPHHRHHRPPLFSMPPSASSSDHHASKRGHYVLERGHHLPKSGQHVLHAQASLRLPSLLHLSELLLMDFLFFIFYFLFMLFVGYYLPIYCGFILLWRPLYLELITS
jgi:hypothetical protein